MNLLELKVEFSRCFRYFMIFSKEIHSKPKELEIINLKAFPWIFESFWVGPCVVGEEPSGCWGIEDGKLRGGTYKGTVFSCTRSEGGRVLFCCIATGNWSLKRANIPANILLIFYLTCIRPVKEYACPVFHNALPAYLSTELEQLQKRAMPIIFPFAPYSDALHQANLETLSRRRQSITTKLFDSITCNSDHKLYELLPPRNNCESNLRQKRDLNVSRAKTKRLKNTFIYSNCN